MLYVNSPGGDASAGLAIHAGGRRPSEARKVGRSPGMWAVNRGHRGPPGFDGAGRTGAVKPREPDARHLVSRLLTTLAWIESCVF